MAGPFDFRPLQLLRSHLLASDHCLDILLNINLLATTMHDRFMLTLGLTFFDHCIRDPHIFIQELTYAEAVRKGLATVAFRFSEKSHWRLPHVEQNKRVCAFGELCLDGAIDKCATGDKISVEISANPAARKYVTLSV
jgi:hypothetical protein